MSEPYHLINSRNGKHLGPFSTETDVALARNVSTGGWETGIVMNREEFTEWLARPYKKVNPAEELQEWVARKGLGN